MRRFPPLFILPSLLLLVGACINVPDVQQVVEEPDAGEPPLQVRLILSRAHTKDSVDVVVDLSRPTTENVELLVDGHIVASLPPPYRLRMETEGFKEGVHELIARVVRDSGVALSEPRQLTVDRTPPSWVSRTPRPGAHLVPVRPEVQAVFSEALDPTTVNASTIQLSVGAEPMPANVSLSSEGTVVTVRPVSPFPVDVRVKVTAGLEVTDLAGNVLRPASDEWNWDVPGFLPLGDALLSDSPSTQPGGVDLQVDAEGRPVVAWIEISEPALYVRRWSGGTWASLGTPLALAPTTYSGQVTLRFGTDGQPVISWRNDFSSSIHVRRWNGTAWAEMGSPIPNPKGLMFHEMGMDASGRWLVGGMAQWSEDGQVLMWQWQNGQWESLNTGIRVEAPSAIWRGQLLLHGAKNPFLIWEQGRGSNFESLQVRRGEGGQWSTVSPKFQGLWGVLTVDREGRLLHAAGGGSRVEVWREDGGTWSPVGPIIEKSFPGGTTMNVGRLVFDSMGMPVSLVYESERPGQAETMYLRRLRDGKWERVGGFLRSYVSGGYPYVNAFGLSSAGRPFLLVNEMTSPEMKPIRVYVPNE
ncbi:Ig-like domain-containing protein [Myxococcus landrumensis]|uniref:Ig-like domain-containing protein n=1 Tax=Myxococcus landrumensis TaxID=2813577 RepID=A0ABX7MYF9_9BACT|nr:Ig-like domain-containing protein [Myxococcus landrumus]